MGGPDEAPVRIAAAEAWEVAFDSIERANSTGWTPVAARAAAGAAKATSQAMTMDLSTKKLATAFALAAAAWDTAANSIENHADVAVDLASNAQTSRGINTILGAGSIGLFAVSGVILAVFRFRQNVSNVGAAPFLVA